MDEKVVYYSDEINDEFSGIKRDTKKIGKGYKYKHNFLWNFCANIVHRIFVLPFAFLFCKIKFNLKIVNRKAFKKAKGAFVYGNHTQVPADGFFPSIALFPQKPYVVVNADNVSLKGTETIMKMLGAFPIPNQLDGMNDFTKSMEDLVNSNKTFIIYPEAHIWPYYNKIRNFPSVSFRYPAKFKKDVYCFTVTYQKHKKKDKPQITLYCDGPFKAEGETVKQQQQDLRDKVYNTMVERAKNSDYEYIKYIKRG